MKKIFRVIPKGPTSPTSLMEHMYMCPKLDTDEKVRLRVVPGPE